MSLAVPSSTPAQIVYNSKGYSKAQHSLVVTTSFNLGHTSVYGLPRQTVGLDDRGCQGARRQATTAVTTGRRHCADESHCIFFWAR